MSNPTLYQLQQGSLDLQQLSNVCQLLFALLPKAFPPNATTCCCLHKTPAILNHSMDGFTKQ